MNVDDEKVTVSISEAARLLGISRGLGYRLAAANQLPVPVLRLGSRRMVISRAALDVVLMRVTNGNTTG